MQFVTAQHLYTSGDIAKILDRSVSQVRHVLNSRFDIEPVGRAGIVRLYDDSAVDRVRSELEAINQKRGTKMPA